MLSGNGLCGSPRTSVLLGRGHIERLTHVFRCYKEFFYLVEGPPGESDVT